MGSGQCCVSGTGSQLGLTAIERGFREVCSGGGDGLKAEVCVLISGKSVRRQSGRGEESIVSSLRFSCMRESRSCIFTSSCNSPSIGVFCAACAMVCEE